MSAPTTTSSTFRTNPLPRTTAMRAPMMPPARLPAPMSRPSAHSTWPPSPNTISAATLVPRFTNFAVADARRNE